MQVFLLIALKEILQVSELMVAYDIILMNRVRQFTLLSLFMAGYSGSFSSTNSLGIASDQQLPLKEVDPACIDDSENGNLKESGNTEGVDLSNRYGH